MLLSTQDVQTAKHSEAGGASAECTRRLAGDAECKEAGGTALSALEGRQRSELGGWPAALSVLGGRWHGNAPGRGPTALSVLRGWPAALSARRPLVPSALKIDF